MNTVGVKTFHDRSGFVCKRLYGSTVDNDMGRRDRFALVETPNVKLVHRLNTGDLRVMFSLCRSKRDSGGWGGWESNLFDILLHIVQSDTWRCNLEQNASATPRQGHRSQQNHDSDEHPNGRIGVEPSGATGFPNDKCRDDNTHIVDRVSDDMDHNA